LKSSARCPTIPAAASGGERRTRRRGEWPRGNGGQMPFRISGKNIQIGEALRARVNERIADALKKYFDGGFSGHVTVTKEGFEFRTECAIHLDSGMTLHADAMAADAYASADQAALRVEKRLRRYKRRLKDHQAARADEGVSPELAGIAAPSYVIAALEEDAEEEPGDFNPVIIAESTTALKRLSVSEAVLELDLTGAPVILFRHAGHGRMNVVYRRADGHIGWIDPPGGIGADDH
jgi:putative sigma-54 modulation protein